MIKPDGMRESAATYLADADPSHLWPSPSAIEDVERPMLRSLLWERELPADDPC